MANMKQLLICSVVLLLIACCICAGCTGTLDQKPTEDVKDSIIGYWVSNDATQTICQVDEDNTVTVTDLSNGIVSSYTATWSKTGENEYLLDGLPFYLSKSETDGTMVNSDGTRTHFVKYDTYPVPTTSPRVAATLIPTPVQTETPSQESEHDEVIGAWHCSSVAVPTGGSFKWQQIRFNADGKGYIEGYDSEKHVFDKIYFAWTNLGTNDKGVNQYIIFTDNGNTLNLKFEKGSDNGELSGSVDGSSIKIDDFKHTFKE